MLAQLVLFKIELKGSMKTTCIFGLFERLPLDSTLNLNFTQISSITRKTKNRHVVHFSALTLDVLWERSLQLAEVGKFKGK